MDELNKQQIVLLTLLVSIVTSIATGITTISLVGQNPVQTVTQTVNRVVEKTIERVVEPKEDSEEEPEKIIEKEIVTVVVNEEDVTIEAIEKNSKSIARVFDSKGGNFISIGVIIKDDGTIYVPSFAYNKRLNYVGEYKFGSYEMEVVAREDVNDLIIMRPIVEEEGTIFNVAEISTTNSLKLGQSIISLSGTRNDKVDIGIVTEISVDEDTGAVRTVDTSIKSNSIARGGILISLTGKIVGVKSGIEGSPTAFSSSNLIFNYLKDSAEASDEEEVT